MFLKGNKNDPEPLSTLWLCKKYIPANVEVSSSRPCPPFAPLTRHLWGNVLLPSVKDQEKKIKLLQIIMIIIMLYISGMCDASTLQTELERKVTFYHRQQGCYPSSCQYVDSQPFVTVPFSTYKIEMASFLPVWEVSCQSLYLHKTGNSDGVTNLGLKNVFRILAQANCLS